jgi:RNA polymerase sigma factor (sigma-70 family)|tara:strand:+ start:399 stop:1082 length:684 start_codon:yes stop_codon:yes gene_type:complete
MPKRKPKFEDYIEQINEEIRKRKSKWNLTALSWMDFDDVSQIIRIHIFKKWHLYDTKKPLNPWINRIISNQIKNLIRNNYGNYCRPCLKCAAAESGDLCYIYGKQSEACPLFANWARTKKIAYNAKLPVSIEDHNNEINLAEYTGVDVDALLLKLNVKMKEVLKPAEWKIYKALYIENLSEEEVATMMGYKTNEKNRVPGYKQIKNVKKSIIIKAKKMLAEGEIEIL